MTEGEAQDIIRDTRQQMAELQQEIHRLSEPLRFFTAKHIQTHCPVFRSLMRQVQTESGRLTKEFRRLLAEQIRATDELRNIKGDYVYGYDDKGDELRTNFFNLWHRPAVDYLRACNLLPPTADDAA